MVELLVNNFLATAEFEMSQDDDFDDGVSSAATTANLEVLKASGFTCRHCGVRGKQLDHAKSGGMLARVGENTKAYCICPLCDMTLACGDVSWKSISSTISCFVGWWPEIPQAKLNFFMHGLLTAMYSPFTGQTDIGKNATQLYKLLRNEAIFRFESQFKSAMDAPTLKQVINEFKTSGKDSLPFLSPIRLIPNEEFWKGRYSMYLGRAYFDHMQRTALSFAKGQ